MKLIIGGKSQGKLEFVLKNFDVPLNEVVRSDQGSIDMLYRSRVVDQVHLLIRQMTKEEECIESINKIIERNPDVIFICDEIGYGIVPVNEEERKYRERVGRTMCTVAKEADEVIRVICGIGQKLK